VHHAPFASHPPSPPLCHAVNHHLNLPPPQPQAYNAQPEQAHPHDAQAKGEQAQQPRTESYTCVSAS
jgi:hypothetical protein